MKLYRQHYKLTSLLILALTIASFGYIEEKFQLTVEKIHKEFTCQDEVHFLEASLKFIVKPVQQRFKK